MKFIVLSDIHFYRNSKKSIPTSDGLTTWCQKQIEVFKSVMNWCIKYDYDTVIINGDLFEEKNHINQTLYNTVWELFNHYHTEHNIEFILNTGNHDTLTVATNSSLIPFSKICTVITEVTDFQDNNTFVRLIPYGQVTKEVLELPVTKKNTLLFTHEHIDGLVWNQSEYWKPSELKSTWFKKWDIVLNGHIHMHQELKNIINIGSPMQQDFGEARETKYFIEYDGSNIVKHEINNGIQHLIYDHVDDNIIEQIEADNTNMYRVTVPVTMLNEAWCKKYNIFPVLEKPKNRQTRLQATKVADDRTDVKTWVSINNTDLDSKKLEQIGMELISGN